MEANRVAAVIFGLVYRLLALAALAWGVYRLAWQPYSIVSLMLDRNLPYTFIETLQTCLPTIVLDGAFIGIGLFTLYFAPRILKVLYRE